ncbi:MAG: hypothetical protein ACT4QA_02310 [Panacagrimonas sp.]
MSWIDLLSGRTAYFFTRNADAPGTLWVFQHVPKTAGSSFSQEFGKRLQPAGNVHADYADPRPTRETMEESLAAFIDGLPRMPCRFVSGHLRGPQVNRIVRAQGRTRLVTLLREPLARVVSDFRYMRTSAHPRQDQAVERHPGFEDYIADPVSQNKMFRFLRRNPKATLDETIDHLEQRFALVGTLEQYALSCRILFRLLGEDTVPAIHANRTVARQENEIGNLEALRARILELNADDVRLYEHFAVRLAHAAPGVGKWLDAHPLPS